MSSLKPPAEVWNTLSLLSSFPCKPMSEFLTLLLYPTTGHRGRFKEATLLCPSVSHFCYLFSLTPIPNPKVLSVILWWSLKFQLSSYVYSPFLYQPSIDPITKGLDRHANTSKDKTSKIFYEKEHLETSVLSLFFTNANYFVFLSLMFPHIWFFIQRWGLGFRRKRGCVTVMTNIKESIVRTHIWS